MPRGLGDSPLKREKNSRRSASHRQATVITEGGDAATATSEGSAGASPNPDSYNDVFFQRRPESVQASSSVPEQVSVEVSAPAVPAPTAATDSVTVVVPQVLQPVAIALPAPEPYVEAPEAAAASPEPPSQLAAAPEPVQVAVPSHTAVAAPVNEAKPGFFGRIFGKLRKS